MICKDFNIEQCAFCLNPHYKMTCSLNFILNRLKNAKLIKSDILFAFKSIKIISNNQRVNGDRIKHLDFVINNFFPEQLKYYNTIKLLD